MCIKQQLIIILFCIVVACTKTKTADVSPPDMKMAFHDSAVSINGQQAPGNTFTNINLHPSIMVTFSAPVDTASVQEGIAITTGSTKLPYTTSFTNNNTSLIIQPVASLTGLTRYNVQFAATLLSVQQVPLSPTFTLSFITQIDSTDKFARISDSALLDLTEQQTLTYFYDFGHPVSGMARERSNGDDNVVTTGGTGFGIMSMIAGANRNFITRSEALQRITTIVQFLKDKCTRYHGAFAHWVNGTTGATVPFSQYDDGGDLVETAYLLQGLLCARQYFNSPADATETQLRTNIDSLWNGVEWNWYRQDGQNALFWHWSPDYGFKTNQQISGWNEAMIVYVLAAASNADAIPKIVYDNGWALNGGMQSNATYLGVPLPLGPPFGGPLFFAHYSFLGINPHDLTDAYANYFTQNTNHALINYNYCVANPKQFLGYSIVNWGLTASDDNVSGYAAHSPTNDDGVISPTAAIASLPYTPAQSMAALRFFYYTLGDKLWKQYGFIDAFNLNALWYSDSFLAIDQGPEIVMIENYRTGLLWKLFMSCPEIKRGMTKLGFQSPDL